MVIDNGILICYNMSMIKEIPNEAILIGGFSESHAVLEGLAIVAHPQRGIFDSVRHITAGEYHENPDRYPMSEVAGVFHSAGLLGVEAAALAIGLCTTEPTPLYRQAYGAFRVAFESIGREDGLRDDIASPKHPAKELWAHNGTLWIPFAVRKFSSSQRLAQGAEDFPNGRVLIQTLDDSFGFTRESAVAYAAEHGVVASIVAGMHNSPLFRPREFVGHIKNAIDQSR
jgi:hypothetical protein